MHCKNEQHQDHEPCLDLDHFVLFFCFCCLIVIKIPYKLVMENRSSHCGNPTSDALNASLITEEPEWAEKPKPREEPGEPLYLVERDCCGCGAWYVTTICPLRPGDRLGSRASPDSERSFYRGKIAADWDRAHPTKAIIGSRWTCSSCHRD